MNTDGRYYSSYSRKYYSSYNHVRTVERDAVAWELTLAQIRALPETYDCPQEEKI